MPRKPDKKDQKQISGGIKKLLHEYEKSGKIKTSTAEYKPENKQKAIKQAAAIEYGKHGIGRAGSRKRK